MKINILILLFLFNISICYYSLQLNKVYLQNISNHTNNNSIVNNETIGEYFEYLKNNLSFNLDNSEINIVNKSYILTKNINSELYTVELYLGSNKQFFRLLLSTFDNLVTVASINCALCNVSNKYNSLLSNTAMKLNQLNGNPNVKFGLYKDSCLVPSKSLQNNIKIKKFLNIPSLNFKVIDNDSSGFLNSDAIDGILGLSFNNDTSGKNFINELYNQGYLSSRSFSIIITSSNVNRLYLGDIMKNDYINLYFASFDNKGQCNIIGNKWKCKLKRLEYKAFRVSNRDKKEKQNFISDANVNFNIKENKLTIPSEYYDLIVRSYKMAKIKNSSLKYKQFNKSCKTFGEIIYCNCNGKDDFRIVTFDFGNYSKLDIDLRDYVHYDKSAFYYKCRTDIILSENNEFIVGLRGLNNTILSFNIEDKKIIFFRSKKKKGFSLVLLSILITLGFVLLLFVLLYH